MGISRGRVDPITPDGEDFAGRLSAHRHATSKGDLGSKRRAQSASWIDDLNNAVDNASIKPAKKPLVPPKVLPKTVKEVGIAFVMRAMRSIGPQMYNCTSGNLEIPRCAIAHLRSALRAILE